MTHPEPTRPAARASCSTQHAAHPDREAVVEEAAPAERDAPSVRPDSRGVRERPQGASLPSDAARRVGQARGSAQGERQDGRQGVSRSRQAGRRPGHSRSQGRRCDGRRRAPRGMASSENVPVLRRIRQYLTDLLRTEHRRSPRCRTDIVTRSLKTAAPQPCYGPTTDEHSPAGPWHAKNQGGIGRSRRGSLRAWWRKVHASRGDQYRGRVADGQEGCAGEPGIQHQHVSDHHGDEGTRGVVMMVAAKVNMVLIATSATLVIVEASEYQRHPGDTEPLTMCVPDENVQSFTATLTAWSDE